MAIVDSISDKIKRGFLSWSQNRFAFLILAALFLGLRLLLLLTNIESLYWPEEIYRGTIAWEILHGLKLPLMDYLPDSYDGGSLWNAWLTAPLFKLFGPSLLTLKLTGLLLAFGSLLLLYGWMKRFFGRETALIAAGFYALTSPVLAATSLYSIGSHSETPVWSAAMIWIFYEFISEKKIPQKILWLLLLGALTGWAFWYCSITVITAIVCFVSWPRMDRSSFRLPWISLGILFSLLALIPFLSYHAAHHFRFLDFIYDAFVAAAAGKSLYPAKLIFIPLRFLRLILQTIPFSFCFKSIGFLPSLWISGVFALLIAGILFPFYRSAAPSKEIPLKLFPFVFILIYSLSNYGTFYNFAAIFYSYRYFTPLYFFLCPLLAVACQKSKRGFFFGLSLCLLGLIGQSSYFFQEPWGLATKYQGMSYFDLGRVWGSRYLSHPREIPAMLAMAKKFPEKKAHRLLLGITDTAKGGLVGFPSETLSYLESVPEIYRPYLAEGWGYMLSDPEHLDPKSVQPIASGLDSKSRLYFLAGVAHGFEGAFPLDHVSRIYAWDHDIQPFWLESLGQTLYYTLYRKYGDRNWSEALWTLNRLSPDAGATQKAMALIQSFPANEKRFVVRGFGHGAALHWSHWQEYGRPFDSLLHHFSREELNDFYLGMGHGFAQDMQIDRFRALTWIRKLPPSAQVSALKGLESFESWYGINETAPGKS
ncbi:MAG: hypothetical protein EXS63_07860 [Candidatus Omnitrophica bacterium]|nr:hypothetical protein [Candidatus Omnitrophota bacterium]